MRQILSQNAAAILLQNETKVRYNMVQAFYYKMRQFCYNMWQLLQNALIRLQNATVIYQLWRFLQNVLVQLPRMHLTRVWFILRDTLTNVFIKVLFIVKFCVCEHDMPFALEKILMAELS